MVINCLREKCSKPVDNLGGEGVIQLQNMDERNIVVDTRFKKKIFNIDEIASARNRIETINYFTLQLQLIYRAQASYRTCHLATVIQ